MGNFSWLALTVSGSTISLLPIFRKRQLIFPSSPSLPIPILQRARDRPDRTWKKFNHRKGTREQGNKVKERKGTIVGSAQRPASDLSCSKKRGVSVRGDESRRSRQVKDRDGGGATGKKRSRIHISQRRRGERRLKEEY